MRIAGWAALASLAAVPFMLPSGAQTESRAEVTIRKDVAYLPERAEKLDLYLPTHRAAEVRSPAVLIIHGGGWTGGDKGAGREINIGTTLARAGYVCASVNYRLGKDAWPTNLQDCKNAIRFLRKNAAAYQVDPERLGVIGGSAGGHLALMVGLTARVAELEPPAPYPGIPDGVRAVVDMYGIADVRTWQKTDAEGNPTGELKLSAATMLGGGPEQFPERWKLASPVEHLGPDTPPILILHGRKDTTVDRDQSINLARRLEERKLPHQLLLIDGVGHTFDLQTWNRKPLPLDLRPIVTEFFDRHVRKVP